MPSKQQLITQLEETQEALARSRQLRKAIESSINQEGFPSIKERAIRLKNLFMHTWEMKSPYEEEFWIWKYMEIITK